MGAWMDRSRRKPLALVLAAVVAVAAIALVAVATGVFSGSSDDPVATSPDEQSTEPDDEAGDETSDDGTEGGDETLTQQGGFVPEPMSGQEAVDELGDRIGEAAEVNNMSAEQLENLLTSDPTVSIAPSGHIVYKDPGPSQQSGD